MRSHYFRNVLGSNDSKFYLYIKLNYHILTSNRLIEDMENGEDVFRNGSIFWDIMQCSLLKVNGCFGRIHLLHLQSRTIRRARILLVTCFHPGFLLGLVIFEVGGKVPPKRRLTYTGLHVVIFQKLELFINEKSRFV